MIDFNLAKKIANDIEQFPHSIGQGIGPIKSLEFLPYRLILETKLKAPLNSPWISQEARENTLKIISEIERHYSQLPEELSFFKEHILDQIISALNEKRAPSTALKLRGILYELERLHDIRAQGFESLSNAKNSSAVSVLGYDDKSDSHDEMHRESLVGQGAQKRVFSSIKTPYALDKSGSVFGVHNKGRIHHYEVKSYPLSPYGNLRTRNHLFALENAIVNGNLVGATVEIVGRIHPNFLNWALGNRVDNLGAIPHVELIYSLPLPSGNYFRFRLKRGEGEGLIFVNRDNEYTLADTKVIDGLLRSIRDRSLPEFLGLITDSDLPRVHKVIKKRLKELYAKNPDVDDLEKIVSEESQRIVAEINQDPLNIQDIEILYRFRQDRLENLWAALTKKVDEYRVNWNEDIIPVLKKEAVDYDYILRSLIEMQDTLKENPRFLKVKGAYLLDPSQYDETTKKALEWIKKIQAFELTRLKQEETVGTEAKTIREKLNYKGPKEGINLSLEHLLMDAIIAIKKDNQRNLLNTSRFSEVTQIEALLPDPKFMRKVRYEIYDPLTGERTLYESEGHRAAESLIKKQDEIRQSNLERCAEQLQILLVQKDTTLRRKEIIQAALDAYVKFQKKREESKEKKKLAIDKILSLGLEKREIKERIAAVSEQYREQSEIFEVKIKNKMIDALGGREEYHKFRQVVASIIDQTLYKFIYSIDGYGNFVVSPEKIITEGVGRATHAELIGGKSSYGSGELVFEEHNAAYTRFSDWYSSLSELDKDKNQWKLVEINNGSGHYRTPNDCLPFVRDYLLYLLRTRPASKLILEEATIKLVDCIMRMETVRRDEML